MKHLLECDTLVPTSYESTILVYKIVHADPTRHVIIQNVSSTALISYARFKTYKGYFQVSGMNTFFTYTREEILFLERNEQERQTMLRFGSRAVWERRRFTFT